MWLGSGRSSRVRVRRRQTGARALFTISQPRRKDRFVGFTRWSLKQERSSRSGTRQNASSDPRSSTLFEIGVPVRHQWCCASSFRIAENCRVFRERMTCAELSQLNDCMELRGNTSLRQERFGTMQCCKGCLWTSFFLLRSSLSRPFRTW